MLHLREQRGHWGLLAAMLVGLALFGGEVTAQEPPCQGAAMVRARDLTPDLQVLLDRLDPAQRQSASSWVACDRTHYDLPEVFERAVRASGASGPDGARLFVSASQTIEVPAAEEDFARTALLPRLRRVEAARPHIDRLATEGGWLSVLVDLNAETHGVEAWTRAIGADAADAPSTMPRDELAAAMLLLVTWLEHARTERPAFIDALARRPAAVDAVATLWRRAEDALIAAPARLGRDDRALLEATWTQLSALEQVFVRAGRPVPAFRRDTVLPPLVVTPAADVGVEDAAVADVAVAAIPDAAPAGADVAVTDAALADRPDAAPASDASTPDAALAAADGGTTADAGADGDAGASTAGTAAPPAEGPWFTVRLVLLGLGALLPWILFGVVALVRRRKPEAYPPLANRLLAISTLLVILEVILVGLALSLFEGSLGFLGWDTLFVLIPPYNFGVLLVMLGRLDTEGALASRGLIRAWAKWGGVTLAGLLVLNIVLAVFSGLIQVVGVPLSTFSIPLSILIVGVMASVFMIKLWRTGNVAADPNAEPPAASGEKPEPKKPEPKKPEPKKSEPKPEPAAAPPGKPTPAPELRPIPPGPTPTPEPKAAPAPAKAAPVPAKAAPAKPAPAASKPAGGAKKEVSEMSDEELAALFDAMEDSGGADDVPDDRKELYALLGGGGDKKK